MEWIAAMAAVNKLLKEIDTKVVFSDEWKPWTQGKKSEKVLKMDVDEVVPTKVDNKTRMLSMPYLRSPREKRGIKERGGTKLKGGKMLIEEKIEIVGDDIHSEDPKAAVMKMLEKAKKGEEYKNKQEKKRELSLIEKKRNREIWRKGMLDRVKDKNAPV